MAIENILRAQLMQTIEDFYRDKFNILPANLHEGMGHFNVFQMEKCKTKVVYSRRDFYKISLIRGHNLYHYADKSIEISGTTLIFFNPLVPYALESLSDGKTGFFCIFSKSFFADRIRNEFGDLPMFKPGGNPSYILNKEQDREVSQIFNKMLNEMQSDYAFKFDLQKSYVTELIHYALKMEPSESLCRHTDAKARITAVFTELLERQFPIENTSQRFDMRSAANFADQLAVHVNHLNKAVKATTGKTTTGVIAERLVSEAKSLLKHTDWNIAKIGYCLGFEEPSHFNNFFKKQTQVTPSFFRSLN